MIDRDADAVEAPAAHDPAGLVPTDRDVVAPAVPASPASPAFAFGRAFPPPVPPPPPRPPRIRRSFAIAFVVIFVAWSSGLAGALIGSYLANRDDEPPRAASTLGIDTAPVRDSLYAAIDVARVAEAIAPSVVAIQRL